jgi:hypothetical protein
MFHQVHACQRFREIPGIAIEMWTAAGTSARHLVIAMQTADSSPASALY